MLFHPLTEFETQKCYWNKPKFKSIYWKNDLTKIKDGAYLINLNACRSAWTHQIALYVNGDNVTFFDTFQVKFFPKKSKKIHRHQKYHKNIFVIRANYSAMCGCFCIRLINFILKGQHILDYGNLFSSN